MMAHERIGHAEEVTDQASRNSEPQGFEVRHESSRWGGRAQGRRIRNQHVVGSGPTAGSSFFTLSQEGHRKIDGLARRFSLYAKFDTLTDTLGVGSLTAEHSVPDRRGLRRGLLLQVAVEVCGDPQLRMPEELGHTSTSSTPEAISRLAAPCRRS